MIYGNNLLPTDTLRYTLHNAIMSNGIMQIFANGSVSCSITTKEITVLPDSFKLSIFSASYTSSYTPDIYVRITAKSAVGAVETITAPVVADGLDTFSTTFSLFTGEYTEFSFMIYTARTITVTLWELSGAVTDVTELTTIIDGVEQSLPKMLYDYNTSPIAVGQLEHTVGLISIMLLDDTDLQGNFLLSYTASNDCDVTLRFKDNDVTELFSPIVYKIKAGRGTIGVPHAYLRRKAGGHSLRATAQVSTGTLSVAVRGILYSVDGGYLASRVSDVGADVCDVALRQISAVAGPDTVYVVGIENDQAFIRSRPFVAPINSSFDAQFGLGAATNAAIEFNGVWSLRGTSVEDRREYLIITHDAGVSIAVITTEYDISYNNDVLTLSPNPEVLYNVTNESAYTLITDDAPYCFWTDDTGTLFVQHGSDVTTRIVLETDVSGISVCRGYKSFEHPELDQGLICLYIKNGEAYYRSYCYNSNSAAHIWEAPVKLSGITGTVTYVHAHRLNDFRIGFAITTSTSNYWLLSTRTYVGQSVLPEHIRIAASDLHVAAAMLPADAVYDDIQFETSMDASKQVLYIDANYPIKCLGAPAGWLSVQNNNAYIRSVDVTGNRITLSMSVPIVGSISVTFLGTAVWQYSLDGGWVALPPQTVVWDLKYSGEAETIAVNLNSLIMTVIPRAIITTQNAYEETIAVDCSTLTTNILMKPIVTTGNALEETIAVDISTLVTNITVTQIGIIPV